MNKIQSLIARLCHIKTDAPLKVQLVSAHTIRLDQWRKDETLLSSALALERNQTYQMAIQVLKNEHPVHSVFVPIGVSPNDRLAHQSKCEGYELCLNNLSALSKPMKVVKEIEARFEPVETEKRRK